MGIRGVDELVAALPPAAADPARALADALADLASLRHAALAPEEVRALGELWERFGAQLASARLGVLAAMDARDDVIPRAKVGEAGPVFAIHVLGQRRGTAHRDGRWADLLRPQLGDLAAVGAAYAAGDITTAHVEVAVRAHKDLDSKAREALVSCEVPDGDDEGARVLRAALAALSDGFTVAVRQVRVVDVLLAHYARSMSVTELDAIAKRIVASICRPDPRGGHERRYLHMDQLPDGTWRARFECGAEQGLIIRRALAAYSEPRPGKAIDPDGVEHDLPDDRDPATRRMDALTDIAAIVLTKNHIPLPTTPRDDETVDEPADEPADEPTPEEPESVEEPPPGEGEAVVLRQPGVLVGPYPSVEMVLVAGIEHVAAAYAHQHTGPGHLPLDPGYEFNAWLQDHYGDRLRPSQEPEDKPPGELPPDEPAPPDSGGRECPGGESPAQAPPTSRKAGAEDSDNPPIGCTCHSAGGPSSGGGGLAWIRHALSPYAVPARVEQAGRVDPDTLALLTCSATVRTALLAPGGALLDLGRTQRLATPTQKTALLARDGGCIIPGCTIPGDACDAHHIIWWTNLGPTNLDNLALLCGRHHTEVHQGTWEIEMLDGTPWVRLPAWMNRTRPLLRNAIHHPHHNRREQS